MLFFQEILLQSDFFIGILKKRADKIFLPLLIKEDDHGIIEDNTQLCLKRQNTTWNWNIILALRKKLVWAKSEDSTARPKI